MMRPALPLTIALLWGTPLAGQDATTALSRAEIAYRGLTSLTAEFSQVIENPMLGGPESSRGLLFLSPPNRFAMRFTDPEGDRIVADGTWLWLYAPTTVPDQVIRQEIPRSGMASPNLMAQFVDRPLERYDVEYLGGEVVQGDSVDLVRLTPRDETLGFLVATIAVAQSDGILRRIAMTEESGQRRTLVFSAIQTRGTIPAGELRFAVPAGVKVVQPD
jgi:outer membrane lipoprotein carrier protein